MHVKEINRKGYDLVLDFTGMPVNIQLMLLFAKTSSAGFATARLRENIYDYSVPIDGNIHIFDNYLKLVTPYFNISLEKKFTFFKEGLLDSCAFAPECSAANAAAPDKCISLVLSSNVGGLMNRRLPQKCSEELISLLLLAFQGCRINLLGGPTDYEYLEELQKRLQPGLREVVCLIKTKTVGEAMLLLKNSLFNVCIDSGLMHLSSLVNPNTYCLFGYSSPSNSLPFSNIGYYSAGVSCAPCSLYRISDCETLECMDKIDVKKVAEELKSIINKELNN